MTISDLDTQLGMIDLNDRALVEITYLYWDGMLAIRRGGVLNVASTASFQPGPLVAVYYASKAFVLSFSEALWEEARGTGVHVSCLCPGPTASKFRERAGTGKTRLAKVSKVMGSMEVAQQGYRAFTTNKRVVVTGTRNATLARLVPFIPREKVPADGAEHPITGLAGSRVPSPLVVRSAHDAGFARTGIGPGARGIGFP